MRNVIANAFSLNMLKDNCVLTCMQVDEETVKEYIKNGFYSVIGHQGTAEILTAKLGFNINYNRENYKKGNEDQIIVCLPSSRLNEGQILTKEELENFKITYWLVK